MRRNATVPVTVTMAAVLNQIRIVATQSIVQAAAAPVDLMHGHGVSSGHENIVR